MGFLGVVRFYSIHRYHGNLPSSVSKGGTQKLFCGYWATSKHLDVPPGRSLKLQKECQDGFLQEHVMLEQGRTALNGRRVGNRCSFPRCVQGRVGWRFEKPHPVEGGPVHVRGLELDISPSNTNYSVIL